MVFFSKSAIRRDYEQHGEKDSNLLLNCWPRIPSLDTKNTSLSHGIAQRLSCSGDGVYGTQMDIYGGREDQTARAFFYSDLCKVVFYIIFPLLQYILTYRRNNVRSCSSFNPCNASMVFIKGTETFGQFFGSGSGSRGSQMPH